MYNYYLHWCTLAYIAVQWPTLLYIGLHCCTLAYICTNKESIVTRVARLSAVLHRSCGLEKSFDVLHQGLLTPHGQL